MDEQPQLHQVQGAVRLSTGEIVVADGGSNEPRFFGARTSLFAPDGEHVRQLRVDLENPTSVTPRGRTSDGRRIVSVLTSDFSSSSLETGVHWPEGLWLLIDTDGSVRDTIGSYPQDDGALYQYHGDGFGILMSVPFAAGTSYDIVDDRLYVATGDRAEVRIHAPPESEEEPAWWGFDADGGFIGRMELPITVYDLRDSVAVGRSTDELDVQHVQVFRYEVGG